MKSVLPNIRYHNDGLIFERTFSDNQSPVISVYDKANNLVDEFGSFNMTEELILEKI
jgi:hypothetical protein